MNNFPSQFHRPQEQAVNPLSSDLLRTKVQQQMLRLETAKCYIPQLEEIATEFIENKVIRHRNKNNEMPDDFQQVCNHTHQILITTFNLKFKNN